jgi:hypothetical protein
MLNAHPQSNQVNPQLSQSRSEAKQIHSILIVPQQSAPAFGSNFSFFIQKSRFMN